MSHYCKCGCGSKVTWNEKFQRWNNFLRGHMSSSGRKNQKLSIANATKEGKYIKSDEQKRRIGLANAQYSRTEEQKQFLRNLRLGTRMSAEAVQKIAIASRRNAADPEFRRKHKEAMNRPETKAKLSEITSAYLHEHAGQLKQTGQERIFQQLMDGRSWKYIGCFPDKGEFAGFNDHNKKYKVTGFTADFVNWSEKKLVWLDGCRWHGCKKCRPDYYSAKREAIDQQMLKRARADGWTAVRIWEHDVLHDTQKVLRMVA